MPSTAIIVDSACSLPRKICDKYDISFAPLTANIDGTPMLDPCDESKALALFASGKFEHKHKVFTKPPAADVFGKLIIEKVKAGYEQIIIQTVNRTQGDTYLNANTALATLQPKLKERNISLRVMDSRTVFSGQGLMAIETIRRLRRNADYDQVRREMNALSGHILTFIVPRSPLIAWERSKERNENNVSWTQALIANTLGIHPIIVNANDTSQRLDKIRKFDNAAEALFKHACRQIERGLKSPYITVSYAGLLSELNGLPGYNNLLHTAEAHKVKIIPSVASLAAGIYTSVGSLSLSLAANEMEWKG